MNAASSTASPATYDWREDMKKAGELKDRAASNNKAAGARLWKACKAGIGEWLPTSSTDAGAENLYGEFLDAYGESRKGDCSKMKSVALAVKDNGLQVDLYDNLSKAYAEARRLRETVKQESQEDEAIESAIENLTANAPKTATTAESAALILLAQGVDEAARLLLDALGATNTDAHRALVRALSQEVAGRIKPAKQATASGPKDGAVQATGTATAPKRATVKSASEKPAPATTKGTGTAKATAKSATKGDPNARMLPKATAKPEASSDKGAPVAAPVAAGEPVEQTEGAAPVAAKRTGGRPVVRRPAVAAK